MARVSSKGDHGSANERPLGRVEPLPTRSAADTPAPAPTPPAPQLRVRAKMPEPNILPLASPYYFRASELEVRPRVVSQVQPRFPDAAIGTVSGKVVLRLKISESGHVDSALIERSDLPQAFQDSAIEAFTNAVAAPGEIGGIAVKSQMLVEVAFDQGS